MLTFAAAHAGRARAATMVWSPAREIALPSNAADDAQPALNSIACLGRGSCVAVGTFLDVSDRQQAMVAVERGGKWGRAQEIDLPPQAAPQPTATLASVACPAWGRCVAVGQFNQVGGWPLAMIVDQSGAHWTRGVVPREGGPKIPLSDSSSALTSIACSAPGSCVAVGYYYEGASGNQLPATTSESNGVWQPGQTIALPSGASVPSGFPTPFAFSTLTSVACPARGDCVASGSYSSPIRQAQVPFEAVQFRGAWRGGRSFTYPTEPGSGSVYNDWDDTSTINSVACAAVASCTAIGDFTAKGGAWKSAGQPIVSTESQGAWGTVARITAAPTNAAPGNAVSLQSVICPARELCVAVGGYREGSGRAVLQAMAIMGSGASWGPAREVLPPADAATGPLAAAHLSSLACASTTSCVAVGRYVTRTGLAGVMAATATIAEPTTTR